MGKRTAAGADSYMHGQVATVTAAGGDASWAELQLAVAKNERGRCHSIVSELLLKVHGKKTQVDLDDPFSFICDSVRLVNTLEAAGYKTIRSVAGASREELASVRWISSTLIAEIESLLIRHNIRKTEPTIAELLARKC